jgi:hypothetical protein
LAGTLNIDTLKADSNLKLQIASANVAFIDANGLTIVGNSLNVGGGRIVVTSNNSISTSNVVGANILTTTGTTALGITANGQITTANAPFILTGGQLQFPATQIASADGNCLDDYEEGTFTPTISYTGGTTGTQTYTQQNAKYIKIGKLVTVSLQLSFQKNTLSGGYIDATILPFTASATASLTSSSWCGWYNPSGTGFINVLAYINTGQAKIYFYRMTAANLDAAPLPISIAEMGTAITFYVNLFYYTD